MLDEALLEVGEVDRALAAARRGHALLLRVSATRPSYVANQLAKACRTLARCLVTKGKAVEGAEVLVHGIIGLAPDFAGRGEALCEPMRGLVDELRILGPGRLVDVPAEFSPVSRLQGRREERLPTASMSTRRRFSEACRRRRKRTYTLFGRI